MTDFPLFRKITLLIALMSALGSISPTMAATPDRSPRQDRGWIGAWGAAPQPPWPDALAGFENQTLRLIVHTTAGGTKVRVRISNIYGAVPLLIGKAHIARRTTGADIDPASDRLLTFAGRSAVAIPPQATALSDPVDLTFPALSDMAISLFLPQAATATTTHVLARQTSYVATMVGDFTATSRLPAAKPTGSRPFLTGLEVAASPRGASLVFFGDSLVDGDGSPKDANQRWPDLVAERLQQARIADLGVLNEGIIGNRLLQDSPARETSEVGGVFGDAGLERFDRDVLRQTGVKYVVLRLGTNDIAFPGTMVPPSGQVTVQEIVDGYRQLIARAHGQKIRVFATTLSPFEGAQVAPGFHTPEKEVLRQAINDWIRQSGEFDGVIDADLVLRDPEHPARLAPRYDSGDHLHTNAAGYAATAEAVPLSWFRPGAGPRHPKKATGL